MHGEPAARSALREAEFLSQCARRRHILRYTLYSGRCKTRDGARSPMDYDIVDDTRPRLQLQSGPLAGSSTEERTLDKLHFAICLSVGLVLIASGWILFGPMQFLALWFGVSMIMGPLAPPMVTGGDCRVGVGEPLLPDVPSDDCVAQIGSRSNHLRENHVPRRAEVVTAQGLGFPITENEKHPGKSAETGASEKGTGSEGEDRAWTVEELELLKKLVVKHPRGTSRRWEVIAEALGGKHSTDSVVKMAKALGERRIGDQDSYSRFLAQRKGSEVAIASPLTQRDSGDQLNGRVAEDEAPPNESDEVGKGRWMEAEDKALLVALKTFPKDSPMRWDKVALAVPGRSKAQCFRRFSELRKNFRSAIGSGSNQGESAIE